MADRRTAAAVPAVLFVVLTALVAARFGPIVRFDAAVSGFAGRFTPAHPSWQATMSAITHTGDTSVLLSLAALALIVLLLRQHRTGVVFLLLTVATTSAVRIAVMLLLHRPRPVGPLTATSGFAYPSGHTASSAIAAGIVIVLGWTMLSSRRSRIALTTVAVTWAVLVGISRVALLAHWPTDVLGGWLLACAVTAAAAATVRASGRADRVTPSRRPSPRP
ncbi:phosphatase PAP2 family protein [Dactylosporangium sp. AC04546]|uniref:phosphatase PAP2 family protein n=1 Tax=Dactylosporangium sp. AC04546 TaxID=2862460 RepID=UPI001EE064A6|nr:phosphatase PAP2 family protein [Dactylosporangium sp. AC04546]WVK88712.1 phosphatase PAP2 family protein [Dactylosporangium sp. AC04546]